MKRALWLLVLAAGCERDPGQTHVQYMPDMVASIPYDAFNANPNTADGRTLQPQVEGTVARGQRPLHFVAGPADATRAGAELKNPWSNDDDTRRRGEIAFNRFCSHCHGASGEGDGLVATRFPRPPSLRAPRAKQLADGQLFHIITFGQGLMPPHGAQVQPDDRWKIVVHLRALQTGAAP